MNAQPTIQIDPSFAYYLNRSEESVASELELAGYRTVRYFVTDEGKVNRRLVEAMRARGMQVWAMVLGNGVYSTSHLPADWPEWQMTLLKPVQDGFFRLSPFSHRYITWKKQALAGLIRTVPFNGVEIAEPYFPEWNGLQTGVYGDVGPFARAAFRRFSGGEMPEFRYRSSPYYYKKDVGRYLLWIEFRVQAVNGFLNELINGAGGVRETKPDIRVATWSVAVNARDALSRVREEQGIDAAEMIRTVRPDLHVVQTHWPDWMRAKLAPDYAKAYRPFIDQIRASHPSLPLGLQADIGSIRPIRRSREWLRRFAAAAGELGYAMWTAYEYHIGHYMYTEPPVPVRAERQGAGRILLEFSKRIDPETAADSRNYTCYESGRKLEPALQAVKVDGNRAILRAEAFPAKGLSIRVKTIRDTPSLWLLPNQPCNETPADSVFEVPDLY